MSQQNQMKDIISKIKKVKCEIEEKPTITLNNFFL